MSDLRYLVAVGTDRHGQVIYETHDKPDGPVVDVFRVLPERSSMAEEAAKKNSRTYKILDEDDSTEGVRIYSHVVDIEASSPTQAIRLVVEDFGAGAYVAIPEGNWTRQRYNSEPQPPKITLVEDSEATAAVDHSVKAPDIIPAKVTFSRGAEETVPSEPTKEELRKAAAGITDPEELPIG